MKLIRSWLWQPEGEELPEFTRHYDARYVWALIAGLGRNLTPPWKLQLWVDKEWEFRLFQELAHRPLMVPFLELVPFTGHDCGGWSRMMEIYRPGCRPEGSDRVLAVGLDTIITGNCDWLFEWDKAPVGFIRDPFVPTTISNSVSTFNREGAAELWTRHVRALETHYGGLTQFDRPSEMHLMRQWWEASWWNGRDRWPENDGKHRMPCLEEVPQKLLSYKAHTKHGEHRGSPSCIYFHGSPKPHELALENPLYELWNVLG